MTAFLEVDHRGSTLKALETMRAARSYEDYRSARFQDRFNECAICGTSSSEIYSEIPRSSVGDEDQTPTLHWSTLNMHSANYPLLGNRAENLVNTKLRRARISGPGLDERTSLILSGECAADENTRDRTFPPLCRHTTTLLGVRGSLFALGKAPSACVPLGSKPRGVTKGEEG